MGVAPEPVSGPRPLAVLASITYHWPWNWIQALPPCAIIESSRFWPAKSRLIVMSDAGGCTLLLPCTCTLMPCDKSAFCVGSVILLASPFTWSARSAV